MEAVGGFRWSRAFGGSARRRLSREVCLRPGPRQACWRPFSSARRERSTLVHLSCPAYEERWTTEVDTWSLPRRTQLLLPFARNRISDPRSVSCWLLSRVLKTCTWYRPIRATHAGVGHGIVQSQRRTLVLGAFIPLFHVLAHVHVHVRGLFSFWVRGLILIGSVPLWCYCCTHQHLRHRPQRDTREDMPGSHRPALPAVPAGVLLSALSV